METGVSFSEEGNNHYWVKNGCELVYSKSEKKKILLLLFCIYGVNLYLKRNKIITLIASLTLVTILK